MLDSVRTSTDSLRDAARFTPGWLVFCSLLLLAQSLLPAVQVILLESLVEQVDDDPWVPLIGLTLVVGLMFPLGQLGAAATQRMAMRLRLRYRTDLAYAAARLTPSRLARADVTTELEASQTMTEAERLGHFGLLVQEFGKFEFTLGDVVRLGSPADGVPDEEVWEAIASAEAVSFTRRMGLDDQLGQQWGGTGISGGQWQRLALARIYLRNAGIWILDEPTSAIDAEAEREIFGELSRTRADRITIVVSHRAWTLREMDRIYLIEGGRVVQEGSYQDLATVRDGRFAEIFDGQTTHGSRGR